MIKDKSMKDATVEELKEAWKIKRGLESAKQFKEEANKLIATLNESNQLVDLVLETRPQDLIFISSLLNRVTDIMNDSESLKNSLQISQKELDIPKQVDPVKEEKRS